MLFALLSFALATPCGTLEPVPQAVRDEVRFRFPERGAASSSGAGLPEWTVAPEHVGATLHVTFLSDGEAFRDRFGFFVHDPARTVGDPLDAITHEAVLWDNASHWRIGGAGECLRTGHTLDIVVRPEWVGQRLGFWLHSDGYDRDDGPTFFSLDALNEAIDPVADHVRAMRPLDGAPTVWLGFEDHYRAGPRPSGDFNDLVVALASTPPGVVGALSGSLEAPQASDRDSDGLIDALDDFPDDPSRAIDNRYPAGPTTFTLAFEDGFPSGGDADFNDFVAAASLHEVLDARGRLVALEGQVQALTRGASHDEASLHLRIGTLPAGSFTVWRTDASGRPVGSVVGDHPGGVLDLALFPDVKAALPATNTAPGDPLARGGEARFHYVPDAPFVPTLLAGAPYDPYLRIAATGQTLHAPGRSELPGADRLDPVTGWPAALIVPGAFAPPAEGVALEQAYPGAHLWRLAGGTEAGDWYEGVRTTVVELPAALRLPPL